MIVVVALVAAAAASFLFWRYVWFFRNPDRIVPPGEGIVSPADGTVVYVKYVSPGEEIMVIKQGIVAKIEDIVKSELSSPKLLIGTFMSPFDVHYNRSPIQGRIQAINHYPSHGGNLAMSWMHLRTLLRLEPYYKSSMHLLQNERTVTRIAGRFHGEEISCYVVQIGGGHVNGIDSYFPVGTHIRKGEVFGMIRVGSQVDLILPRLPNMHVKVRPGDTVRAGESILVE
ncbi:MAG: phosphatidylserine decarboxylase [Desulfomonile sp.]|nr:phosphatidylserine decarboxylase [Desulfomonile sp.]